MSEEEKWYIVFPETKGKNWFRKEDLIIKTKCHPRLIKL